MAGSVDRPLPPEVEVRTTLARGRIRAPYRVLGQLRALRAHDKIVARRLAGMAGSFDIVHAWPLGARHTLAAAKRMGIPTVLERPNAHTRFAYDVVRRESERLGVELPRGHEHAFDERILRIEEEEYGLADHLLCPSDFVVETFVDAGYPRAKLLRHVYGYDETVFFPPERRRAGDSLRVLFVGVAAVRKGLHFALEAWLRSPASQTGEFLVAGSILPAYEAVLDPMLRHPSVHVLGHRTDVADLMRASDVLVLPSLEEGSALVCSEALGTGCVPLASDAASGVCMHGVNALVHSAGDIDALTRHIDLVHGDPHVLEALRVGAAAGAARITWSAAGETLLAIYKTVDESARRLHA